MSRILLIVFTLFPIRIMADTWFYPEELISDKFIFNQVTIERIIDARKDQQYPDFQVKVFIDDEEVATYINLTFDHIQAFDSGNYIFAGSNSGLSRFAYFVIDERGGLVSAQLHSDNIFYCSTSISVVRKWLPEQVEIKEQYYGWGGIFSDELGYYSTILIDYTWEKAFNNKLNNYLDMLLTNDFESYWNMLQDKNLNIDSYDNIDSYVKDDKKLYAARIKNCEGDYLDILKFHFH